MEGVKNDGVNVHRYDANQKVEDMPLIALAGVGADTTNQTNISRMGDFKERLNFAPSTFVDYGGSVGASVTTASDGSPIYSVDDDVLPTNFFDVATGEFVDSELSRMRSRLMVNFGNVRFGLFSRCNILPADLFPLQIVCSLFVIKEAAQLFQRNFPLSVLLYIGAALAHLQGLLHTMRTIHIHVLKGKEKLNLLGSGQHLQFGVCAS